MPVIEALHLSCKRSAFCCREWIEASGVRCAPEELYRRNYNIVVLQRQKYVITHLKCYRVYTSA